MPAARQDALAVWGLTLLALALRLWRASAASLRGDEAFSVLFASRSLADLLGQLRAAEPHPPLYYVGLHLWMRLAGDGELAVRLPSILAGALLVPLVYALARTWAPGAPAVLASLLVAVNPFLLWHSQDARMYTLLPAFAAASLGFATRALDSRSGRPIHYVGLVAASVLTMYTHYAGVYVLLAENVAAGYVAARALGRRGDRTHPSAPSLVQAGGPWLASQAAVVALCLPWWVYAREVLLGRNVVWLTSLDLPTLLRQAWYAYSLGPTVDPRAAPLLAAPFLPPLAIGLVRLARSRPGQVVALCLAVPLLAAYVTSLRRPVFLDRYFVFVVPVYAVALAAGLAGLRARSRTLFAANLLAVLAVSASALAGYYLDPRLAKSPDWRGAGGYVVAHYRPGDVLVLNSPDPALAYYVRRPAGGPVPTVTLPAAGPPSLPDAEAALAKLAAERNRVWMVPVRDPSWDGDGAIEGWLEAYAQPLPQQQFGDLRLRLFATPRALLAAHPRPQPLTFGGRIEYLGYDLSRDGSPGSPAPLTLRPGETIWLTLYFRALRPVEGEFRVFNHLLDEADRLRGQHDGTPVSGQHPTPTWQAGELVMDRHQIPVAPDAPPGSYRIRTGYYDPSSGRRLPVADEAGRPVGDSVTIEGISVAR